MRPEVILDPARLDLSARVADAEQIAIHNPHRFGMVQLTRVVLLDRDRQLIAGYKDVRADEFWVRGHFPGYPVLPGVLMCEAAAQLCGYYVSVNKIMGESVMGFGGMEGVRFRHQVRPGDRLVLLAQGTKLNRRQVVFHTQGFVGDTMVFHGDLIGVVIAGKEVLQTCEG
jgi:3-hydroxyacyl-[acyl-carrier-protein] dehydratase